MQINLKTGTLDSTPNLDGWIITSETAIAEGAEDMTLRRGDRININGDVRRGGDVIANIS